MTIYNVDGSILIDDAPITAGAERVEELMKGDYVKLSWASDTYQVLPAGAYIMYEGVKYALMEEYKPETKNEVKCQYEPEFQHPMMILDHTPCLLATNNASGEETKEPTWTYTGTLQTIVGRMETIIQEELGWLTMSEITLTTATQNDLATSASISFDGDTIWGAFDKICQAWESKIEFAVRWETSESGVTICKLYFGDIAIDEEDRGGVATLTDGENCVTTGRSESGKYSFANYYNVRGGTRNIAIMTQSGDNVQTDTRMTLDETEYPGSVIDKRESESEPKIQETLIFDDVYPSLTLYCHDIRKRTRRRQDDNGDYVVKEYNEDGSVKEYKTYAIYYMKLSYPVTTVADDGATEQTEWKDFAFDPNADIVSGKKIMCTFTANEKGSHSLLAGRDFQLYYHTTDETIPAGATTGDSGVKIDAGMWEIVMEEEDDLIIPNEDTLWPWGEETASEECDTLQLYNILLTGDYLTSAKAKLAETAIEEIARRRADYDNYTVKSYPKAFQTAIEGGLMKPLFAGQKVKYATRSGEMETHIIKIETRADCKYSQTITLGNAKIQGTLTSVKDEVKVMSGVVDTSSAGVNTLTKTLASVMKQLREWSGNFLSKKEADTAAGKITFADGMALGDGTAYGADKDGAATMKSVTAKTIAASTSVGNGDFVSGYAAGSGWSVYSTLVNKVKKWTLEIDNLVVRSAIKVFEMVVSQLVGENDNRIFAAMAEVVGLNRITYYLYVSAKEEKMLNPFRKGDVLECQQFKTDGATISKHYRLTVQSVADGTVKYNKEMCVKLTFQGFTDLTGNGGTSIDLVTAGDTLVRVDSTSDESRKGIVGITSVGEKTPYLDVIYGKTTETNPLKVRLGNLSGVSDDNFGGALSGWGLYAENAYLKGQVHATSGTFNGKVYATDGEFKGKVTATSGEFNGTVNATDGTFKGRIEADEGYFDNGTFDNATVTGTINANKGKIAQFDIQETMLYSEKNEDYEIKRAWFSPSNMVFYSFPADGGLTLQRIELNGANDISTPYAVSITNREAGDRTALQIETSNRGDSDTGCKTAISILGGSVEGFKMRTAILYGGTDEKPTEILPTYNVVILASGGSYMFPDFGAKTQYDGHIIMVRVQTSDNIRLYSRGNNRISYNGGELGNCWYITCAGISATFVFVPGFTNGNEVKGVWVEFRNSWNF